MGRYPCCEGNGLKKGPWTPEEDQKLVQYIQKHGHGCWKAIPALAGLNRCGKSCRLRWTNYLRPDIKRGKFSKEEEETILNLHSILGNKWSTIATHLPGRTDNEIKNFWNTHLKKKLIQMGFDPMTHRLRPEIFAGLPHLIALANLTDSMGIITWGEQAVRLQEAAQIAKFQYVQCLLQSAASVAGSSSSSNPGMDAFNNLLDSVPLPKENMAVNNSLLGNAPPFSPGIAASQPLHDQMPFNPAEDMKFSNSFQQHKSSVEISQSSKFTVFSQGDYTQNPPLPPPPSPLIENPTTPPGDACTPSSSYGAGHLFWSELLPEDPFFY